MLNLRELMDSALPLVQRCGELALQIRSEVEWEVKPDGSVVTWADREIETLLRKELPKIAPGTTVWGEEQGYERPGPNGLWIVDPVDGTSNYLYGSPMWGVSVALMQGHDLTLGLIVLPDLGETYAGGSGIGACLNGEPLQPIVPGPIAQEQLVSYSDTLPVHYGADVLPGKMRYTGALVCEASYFFKRVFRAVITAKASLYDVAASIVIARELDADVRWMDGEEFREFDYLGVPILPRALAFLPKDSGFVLR